MFKRLLPCISVFLIGLLVATADTKAQETLRIAAVVNDDVISVLDVENRLRLVLLESGLQNDRQTRRRLIGEVVRQLIDERLRMQEAERAGVRIGARALEREFSNIAKSNNMTPDQLKELFAKQNVDFSTLQARLEANLAWQGIVTRRLRRLVGVGEDEIDEELERLKEALSKPQKQVREIFLAVENPDRESEVRQSIARLRQQIQDGADFGALARTFSQSASAENYGDLGWVTTDQFQEEINAALSRLAPNQISQPIRSIAGYHLLQVLGERQPSAAADPLDAKVSLIQLTIPVDAAASQEDRAAALAAMASVRSDISSCADVEGQASALEGAKTNRVEDIRLGDLSVTLRENMMTLQTGQTTQPLDMGRSIGLITVCKRVDENSNLPTRNQIREKIGTERLNLVARRYLRDIRRDAFIDIRL